MARRSVLRSVLLLAAAAGCSTSPDPRRKAEIDSIVSRLEPGRTAYDGTVPFERTPLAVGQWTEYLAHVSVNGGKPEPALLREEVVGQEGEAFWIQQATKTYYGSTAIKLLVRNFGHPDPNRVEVLRVLVRSPEGKVVEVPGAGAATLSRTSFDVKADRGETVTVPAGTFENTVVQRVESNRAGSTLVATQWLNSRVPISAVVKGEVADGSHRQELIGFGMTGARDAFDAVKPE